jgi:hypothetical protein
LLRTYPMAIHQPPVTSEFLGNEEKSAGVTHLRNCVTLHCSKKHRGRQQESPGWYGGA